MSAVSSHLNDSKVELGGEKLVFDAPPLPVTLFVGNMTDDDDAKLREDMEQYGALERCFIMRTPEEGGGGARGYAFVEFSLPSAAGRAKDAIEERFRKQFNEAQAKRLSISKIKAEVKRQQELQQQQQAAWVALASGQEPPKVEATVTPVPEESDGPVKIIRAEFMSIRTAASLFSKCLYISNLPQVRPPLPSVTCYLFASAPTFLALSLNLC